MPLVAATASNSSAYVDQLVPGDTVMKIIHGPPNHQRKKNPDAVGQENADRPHHIAAAVLLKVGKQGTQAFRQHVLVRCDSTSTSFSFAARVPIAARFAAMP